nr:ADOR113 [Adoxophyes orana granulovirus]
MDNKLIYNLMVDAAKRIFGDESYDLRDEQMHHFRICAICDTIGPLPCNNQPVANYICTNCGNVSVDVDPNVIYPWQDSLQIIFKDRVGEKINNEDSDT